ncbi:MFS transporter [Nocardiopsis dassonvillei]|uniref:MFS transporter n=1 Tax=Nocardiopsis dassonvillei TaxID=2014 RepID=UPI003F54C3B7
MTTTTPAPGGPSAPASGGLLASAGFRRFFAARTLAETGTEVAAFALPLLAVLVLDATPAQVGLLGALATAAYLLVGLPAGVWTDRLRRRPVLVAGQLLHGLVLLSIPLAWALDALTLGQLYVCALLGGVASLFARIAQQGLLPSIVGRDRLMAANSALGGMSSTALLAGRGAGGHMIQYLGAPFVILLDGLAQCASGLLTLTVRVREPAPATGERRLPAEMAEGVRHVFGHPLLRAMALSALLVNLGLGAIVLMAPVLIVTDLGLPEGRVGWFFMVGAAGVLVGSLVATRAVDILGPGRTLLGCALLAGAGAAGVPFLSAEGFWAVAALWALSQAGIGAVNVVQLTLRQRWTPDHLLGRMTATLRFMMTGALTVSALYAGAVAQVWGVRAALVAGAAIVALGWIPLARPSSFPGRFPEPGDATGRRGPR